MRANFITRDEVRISRNEDDHIHDALQRNPGEIKSDFDVHSSREQVSEEQRALVSSQIE